MRTTITLDDDVPAKLNAEMRSTGGSLKETVNETLLRGLLPRRGAAPDKPFRVQARDLGALPPGPGLDDISGLLERIEGEQSR
jgi:hypothetical protein